MRYHSRVKGSNNLDMAGGELWEHNNQPYVVINCHCKDSFWSMTCYGRSIHSVNRLKNNRVEWRYQIETEQDFIFHKISILNYCHR